MTAVPERPGRGVLRAMTSWRTASVSLLSFSSGLPLGLVWIAIPDWMRSIGVDIRVVGLITLAQAPWSFKMLWSPLMDRYAPPWLGRRRGWAAVCQVALFALTLGLAGLGSRPETPWVVGALALAIAFASASQDIAIDAYAVDVLRKDEQGVAVGARIGFYRAAMYLTGVSISLAARFSWPATFVGLALVFPAMVLITARAPEPERRETAPKTLRDAVWLPFLGMLSRPRALEILAFVVTYKLADALSTALVRPFLIDMGYSADDRGFALATVGLAATLIGTFFGGSITQAMGLGRALWTFGVLQAFANIGYVLVASTSVNRPLMYSAVGCEALLSGMGTGAFSVLLLRMTQKRFSATQYAVFSSLFSLPRIVGGPVCGFLVDAVGWKVFFWITIAAGAPSLVLLQRFVPVGVKDPDFEAEPETDAAAGRPLPRGSLTGRGVAGFVVGAGGAALVSALLSALKAMHGPQGKPFDLAGPLGALMSPAGAAGWVTLAGVVITGLVCGLLVAAVGAVRRRP